MNVGEVDADGRWQPALNGVIEGEGERRIRVQFVKGRGG